MCVADVTALYLRLRSMKLNRQSNIYTVVYIIIMVVVVGAALAYTAMALRGRQSENARADKMKQILASIHVLLLQERNRPRFSTTISQARRCSMRRARRSVVKMLLT